MEAIQDLAPPDLQHQHIKWGPPAVFVNDKGLKGFDGYNTEIKELAPACSVLLMYRGDTFMECEDTIDTIVAVAPMPWNKTGFEHLSTTTYLPSHPPLQQAP